MREHKSLLRAALALLALCRGGPQKQVCNDLGINDHEWRKWGVEVLRGLRDSSIADLPSFMEQWLPRLKIANFGERSNAVADEFENLQNAFNFQKQPQDGDWSSSIHQAKGLEGNAVLVVASSLSELQKWSETDRAKRNADKQDCCRLGFVAFSRAMELLCIACMKPLDDKTRSHLQRLGVTFLPIV